MDNNQSWYNPSGNGVQVQPINDSKVLEKLDRLIDICNSQEETMEKLYQFFMNEKNVLSKDTSVPYNVLADTPVETPETETNEELKEDNLLTDSIPSVSDIEVPEVNLENPITDESSESEPNIEENTSVEQDNNIKGINDLLKSFEQEQTVKSRFLSIFLS